MWKLRAAIRAFIYRLRFPIVSNHSSTWDIEDHSHICIAVRLLSSDDFIAVCPCNGKCEIDFDDKCDNCRYFRVLDYDTESNGEKTITLY
jgi:hypothetical protein